MTAIHIIGIPQGLLSVGFQTAIIRYISQQSESNGNFGFTVQTKVMFILHNAIALCLKKTMGVVWGTPPPPNCSSNIKDLCLQIIITNIIIMKKPEIFQELPKCDTEI